MEQGKKKILFVIPEYSHGGTNKSLENLLLFLNKEMYDISIFCLYEDGGDYFKNLFKPYLIPKSHLYYWLHDNTITRKIIGIYNKITKRDNFTWLYKREAHLIQIKHNYDTVIAFQEGSSTFYASHIPINKRIAWIHCDYGVLYRKNRSEKQLYDKFKTIVCVSNNAARNFTVLFPEFEKRTIAIHNVMDVDSIIKKSHESVNTDVFNGNTFNIVSIGRFVKVKQFEVIPQIANRIKQRCNIPFKWYIIGSGDETKECIIREIKEYALEDIVVLLGAQDNPYKYIQNCHLLICTSHSESYPTVINEAKILHVPVMSNNFPSAGEVVNDKCGWTCPIEEMPTLITKLLNDEDKIYSKVKETISSYEYENEDIMKKIISII